MVLQGFARLDGHCRDCAWTEPEQTEYPAQNLPVFAAKFEHHAPESGLGIDITYVRLQTNWLYLVAVLDWFSRYVISWEFDQTLELPFVLSAVQRALVQATPQIWNSDQGSHFTSPQYTSLLLAANVQISMAGRGRALDNIFVERLWRSVKYEEVYLHDYGTPCAHRQIAIVQSKLDCLVLLIAERLRAARNISAAISSYSATYIGLFSHDYIPIVAFPSGV